MTPPVPLFELEILGIDPGKESGWGRFFGSAGGPGRLHEWGVVPGADTRGLLAVVNRQAHGVRRDLVIENQWVPRYRPGAGPAEQRKIMAQAAAALSVAEVRGAWRGLATATGFQVVTVSPATWRAAVLGGTYAAAPREQVKRVAISVVAALYGILLPRKLDHAAEAICLASYLETLVRTGQCPEGED